jgi:hypothetical protein
VGSGGGASGGVSEVSRGAATKARTTPIGTPETARGTAEAVDTGDEVGADVAAIGEVAGSATEPTCSRRPPQPA